MITNAAHEHELLEHVSSIRCAAADLAKFCEKHQLPLPTSSASAPAAVDLSSLDSAPYFEAKAAIIDAAEQLIRLVRGPREYLLALSFEHCATASLQVILKYKFAKCVPLDGTTTYAAIAQAVGRPEVQPALVSRIIDHSTSYGIFDVRPGSLVAHSPASALLVTNPDLEAWMDLSATIACAAGASILKTFEKYGYRMEADEAAYGKSIGRKISQFQRFREKEGGTRLHEMFARAMRGIAAGGAYDFRHALNGGYPWHQFDQSGHLVVDVGGGPGHVAIALAEKHLGLRFEVQDLPETVAVGERSCPDELKSRVKYRSHDSMTTQPPHDVADDESIAYFCRFILHDWSDKYARRILQGLASALRPQDRIVVNEVVVPDPGTETRERERRM
ncbi:putative O-methyltransferase [Colletotrichum sublineola]|uniref:Putative O-methyltransferase n=1 Tax=Colletotrichum sublineola TaxID=1173701 RepID=A0A066XQ11_COLSU|nr:putative O-methyltransferase [Colletotrichum sublineola]